MIKAISSEDTLLIRQKVLWPNKPLEALILAQDQEGFHYGYFENDLLVAVISLFINSGKAQFRKFACLEAHQGKGYGSQLLQYTITQARSRGAHLIWCNARKDKNTYYQKFGLKEVENSDFKKGNISYIRMELK